MSRTTLYSIILLVIGLSLFPQQSSYAQSDTDVPTNGIFVGEPSGTAVPNNGIFVGEPKVYDDRSLQILLNNLRARLGQISGLDQSSLISRMGGLQGASATQSGFSIQATGAPAPGVMTTSTPGLPSQTQVTTPSVTPSPSVQPTMPSYTMPPTFSPSALDTLGEQMQLSYEIINLQMLLEGSLNDQYIKGTHFTKQHETVGFPISIALPNKDFRNAVAEVEITICNPPAVADMTEAPSLMTLLPREKTYNVASLVNKSFSLGAGAVISGIINIGGSFLWGRETYYIVRDQDTIAIQRPPRKGVCKPFPIYDKITGKLLTEVPSIPLTFAWQFRPVLGQKIVQEGLRQTFAQISFPNPFLYPGNNGTVLVSTKWRKYYSNHIVGDELPGSLDERSFEIASFFQAPYVQGINTVDNHDGSMTVLVKGNFLSGARVRIGSAFLDDSTPGFLNTLNYIRFTASNQSLAMNGASVVNRDNIEKEILAPNPSATEARGPFNRPPHPEENTTDIQEMRKQVEKEPSHSTAALTPFSNTLVLVAVPLQEIPEVPPGGPYPLVVILGGKAFGLSDAPFKSMTDAAIVFLAPKDLVYNQRTLTVERLFLGKKFKYSVDLPMQSDFAVAGITILSSDKKATKFAIMGTALEGTKVIGQSGANIDVYVKGNGTIGFFKLTSDQLAGVKQLVLQNGTESPILVAVPDTNPAENKPKLAAHDPISPGTGVKYTITGSMLEAISAVRYLHKQLPFALSLDKKLISLTLPDEMTATEGIRSLSITYADGSTDRYTVTVAIPKPK